jgi:SynChlorMet cassette radical SAM/SPASM protein ScmE
MRVMKTPRSVDVQVTGRCNLRCTYCSHFGSEGDVAQDLSTGEWIEFFGELNRCSVLDVCLEGGEPFMRADVRELIEGIVRNRMRFSILTNGTLVTDEIAGFLASTGRCNSIQVSIDGATPASHERFRGEGTFHRAVSGAKHLLRHGLPVTVRVTVHRENVRELERISRMLLEEMKVPAFSTNAASHFGLCRQNAETVQLSTEERCIAMNALLRLTRQYRGRINATAGPLAEARDWLRMEDARIKGEEGLPGRGYLTGCTGPMVRLAVRADGVMIPCSQLPGIELGRINRDDLADVWQHHADLNRFRERCGIPLARFEYCRDCAYRPYCTGGCPALSYSILADPYHPSPDACFRRFLEEGGTLPDRDLLEDAEHPEQ